MITSRTFFLFFEKEHANINSLFFAVNSILFTTRHFECDEENLRQMLRIFANFTETGETALPIRFSGGLYREWTVISQSEGSMGHIDQ